MQDVFPHFGNNQITFKWLYETFGWVWDINPTLVEFTLFGHEFSVKWYGVLIAVGFLLALLYAYRRAPAVGINTDKMTDVAMLSLLMGFVGARLYYVLFNADYLAQCLKEPLKILRVWEGGLGIYGGIIFGLGFGVLFCKLFKIDARAMMDIASVGFLIGQTMGRWGNFFNQEAFGGNTDLPWGMSGDVIAAGVHGSGYDVHGYVHPTFLYESLWCLVGFILLHILFTRFYRTRGQILCGYLVWYGIGRFLIESLRTDSLMLGSMKVSQLVAVVAVILGVVLYFAFRGWDHRLPKTLEEEPDENEKLEELSPDADPEVLAEQDTLDGDAEVTDGTEN